MSSIFGIVTPPPGAAQYGDVFTGLVPFLNNILRLIFVIAGLYGLFNLIIAGFGFMTAGGDPKAIEKAWAKIWQSLVGLIIIVCSFILAAIFGYILFGSPTSILNPKIYGPGLPCKNTAYFKTYSECVAWFTANPPIGQSASDWCKNLSVCGQ